MRNLTSEFFLYLSKFRVHDEKKLFPSFTTELKIFETRYYH